jgi:hypothetical protein
VLRRYISGIAKNKVCKKICFVQYKKTKNPQLLAAYHKTPLFIKKAILTTALYFAQQALLALFKNAEVF